MSLHFFKMHGCGNDFLILDNMAGENPEKLSPAQVSAICDRNMGVGADGIVILERSYDTDAGWKFYNCDGSEAEMCGNAARCAIKFLTDRYYPRQELISLNTRAGTIKGRTLDQNLVEITMTSQAGQKFEYGEKILKKDNEALRLYCLNTGVPHAVLEVDDIKNYPINEVGKFLGRHPTFLPEGTNVTYFQRLLGPEIFSTTFERGLEKETLACGTGVAAAAIVYSQLYLQPFPVQVKVPGGVLEVDLSPQSKFLLLRGPADYVMEVDIKDIPQDFQRPRLYNEGK